MIPTEDLTDAAPRSEEKVIQQEKVIQWEKVILWEKIILWEEVISWEKLSCDEKMSSEEKLLLVFNSFLTFVLPILEQIDTCKNQLWLLY